jgi:sterol desaturase/sphingolipid hydroxylase (fatty acid hydroxylase superfamily)
MVTGHPLEKIINGPAHHTLHHIYFNVNYGQVRGLFLVYLLAFLVL